MVVVLGIIWSLWLASLASCAVLVDFQVAQPPPVPKNAKQCTVEVFQHTFGNSFGAPAIVDLVPPTDCGTPGSWAAITLNLTVTSNGTQFDRLGIFTFKNVEFWRTSTPEPTTDGIIWTYIKDVTRFMPLFATSGTFIFELDNLLETGLNGQYATTLTATYFESSSAAPPALKANAIIPLSTLSNTSADDASVPPGFSINVTVPTNTVQLYAELFASGNGNEEFWYFNVPDQFLGDLPAGFTFGGGSLREVRLSVDGRVAGTALPYPVIFTGGIDPTAWRPITSYGALDLPTYVLDLTPFVPLLTDGHPHNFTIDVASAESNHTINQNWFVSGLLQVVQDSSTKPTTGRMTAYDAQPFAVASSTANVSANGDVVITVTASRQLHIESEIISGSGIVTQAVFTQSLQFSNTQEYLNDLADQNVIQTTTGTVSATHNGVTVLTDDYSFPLNINITCENAACSTFRTDVDHSYDRTVLPAPFILGSTITEHQLASGFFTEAASGNTGNGTSNNTLTYKDTKGNTFDREVDAALNVIVSDHQGGSLAQATPAHLTGLSQEPLLPQARLPGGRRVGKPPA